MNAKFNIKLSAIDKDGKFITETHNTKMGVETDTFNDSKTTCLCFEIKQPIRTTYIQVDKSEAIKLAKTILLMCEE
jgi:hypothetical protein